MQETLMEMGRSPMARNVLRRIGIKPPPQLLRSRCPWSDDLLQGKHILLSTGISKAVPSFLKLQKATVSLARRAEATGGPDLQSSKIYQGSVFDASRFSSLRDLKSLYAFFHGLRGQLGFNHRAVILTAQGRSPEGQAIASAVASFARSLARELGPKGMNVNTLQLSHADLIDGRALPVLSFFLSDFCAFVTGQIIPLSHQSSELSLPRLAGSLAGKRALVTGAAQGIGYAISRRLAEEGAHVICLDRTENEAALKELSAEIDGEYVLATLGRDHDELVGRLRAKEGALDILVHNAGVTRDRTLFGMSEKEWDEVLHVNLEAVIDITTKVLHRGMLAPGGRILCMASVVGVSGNFGQTNYAASKAGLIGYVQGLAEHLAREGGTANAVAPGFIETAMTARIPFVPKQFARRLSSLMQGGQPDDVADMVAFLASPCSQSINGQTLRVCGGSFLGA